jgi:uncharacterized protein (TIGR02145 family)
MPFIVKTFIQILLFISIVLFLIRCKRDTCPTIPFFNVKMVAAGGIQCYATISSDGGAVIVERGFKWKSKQETDYKNGKIAFDNGLNYFETLISGLAPSTTYCVKAYATNSEGIGYSVEKEITTSRVGTFTDSRDGKTYRWVEIGNQVWMAENLSFLPYISPFTNDTGIFVCNYKGSSVEIAKSQYEFRTYGCLYTYEISLDVCPDGWHLPSDYEWAELKRSLGMTSQQIANFIDYNTSFFANMIKSTNWINPNSTAQPNDVTLFSALPAGDHYHQYSYYGPAFDTYFSGLGVNAGFWSSTKCASDDFVYKTGISYSGITNYVANKNFGYSVRCVKDK